MKYNSIKNQSPEYFSVDAFGGLNSANDFESENKLKLCKNVWQKNGKLVTRPSFGYFSEADFFKVGKFGLKFTITDSVFFKDGVEYNVAYYTTVTENESDCLYICLVNGKDEVVPFGHITPVSEADETYSITNAIFIVGNKTIGDGIYAFVTERSGNTKRFRVYEATGNNTEWTFISRDLRYIPTILYNGHGTLIEEAMKTFTNINFGTPTVPEQINLLNPRFKAYFTSDGYSWTFQLPEQNLNSDIVTCKIYMDDTRFVEFNIGDSGWDEQPFWSGRLRAYCVREEGKIYFKSNGAAYTVPVAPNYAHNNIIVTASKDFINGEEKVVTSKGVAIFNSRAYLYNNDTLPNEICSCRLSNPLYFPKNARTSVGADNQKIVTAGHQNDKLIIFKESEIYKVGITNNAAVAKSANVSGRGEDYMIGDNLSNMTISSKIGCAFKDTLAESSGQLIWLGQDGKVYTLETTTYGSEKNIFSLSEKVNHELSEMINQAEKPFAYVKDGYYYLFFKDKAFICDCHINNMGYAKRYGSINNSSVSWFMWEFPEREITGGKNCNQPVLSVFHDGGESGQDYFYLVKTFDEDFDSFITETENNEPQTIDTPIDVKIVSVPFDFKSVNKKSVKRIDFSLDFNNPLLVKLITDKEQFLHHIHNIERETCIETGLFAKPTYSAAFSVEGKGKISLSKVIFKYKAVE